MDSNEIILIGSGRIKGYEEGGVLFFKGIPYAAPPVGNLRWKPPQPPASWKGTRDCTAFVATAPQSIKVPPAILGPIPENEDCLYLNVSLPANRPSDKLPVMVWLHGASYTGAHGNIDPCPLLVNKGIVLVGVNMRLGILGLLAHPLLDRESPHGVSGNYMFLDMIAALKWIQKNISAFGGDPDNVTIFGNSGGGCKVSVLMATPLAKGLFHRAIIQSGAAVEGFELAGIAIKEMEERGEKLFNKLGVDKEADPLKAARALPWDKIAYAGGTNAGGVEDATVDGWFLPDLPDKIFKTGKQNVTPVITFADMAEFVVPGTHLFFPTLQRGYINIMTGAAKTGAKGYAAILEHVPSKWKAEGVIACHAMELPYIFGDMNPKSTNWVVAGYIAKMTNPNRKAPVPPSIDEKASQEDMAKSQAEFVKQNDPGLNEVDLQLSEDMMTMWVQFARTGNPSVKGLIRWPVYNETTDKYLALDEPLKVKSGFSKIKPLPRSDT
jgi:para-nitrobenzyl esterase